MKANRRIGVCLLLVILLTGAGAIAADALRITTTVPVPLLGDADCNGKVNVRDVTKIQRYLAESETTVFNRAAADANGDRSITIDDATLIQLYLAEYPCSYTNLH